MNQKTVVLNTVEMISQLMGELESKAFEQEGFSEITMHQMLYLETIGRLGEPTFGELADHLGVTRPSVSGLIKKLIKLGYVEKNQSSEDGRVYYLKLSEIGLRFNVLHNEVHQLLAHRITKNLDQNEINALEGLLEKITTD
ncbi:MAG: MarR family transcriptional regulator [Anaerolineales bacterium]|nr:MAG: MarR family transcriptional regulator [Anaerolineales bacterium]